MKIAWQRVWLDNIIRTSEEASTTLWLVPLPPNVSIEIRRVVTGMYLVIGHVRDRSITLTALRILFHEALAYPETLHELRPPLYDLIFSFSISLFLGLLFGFPIRLRSVPNVSNADLAI